jgi:predicted lipoprotein with Yx(FWY)xxD motif
MPLHNYKGDLMNKLAATVTFSMIWLSALAGAQSSLVQTVTNDEGENLVADNSARTLYVFDMDQGRPQPACNGDCAEVWPPYLLNEAEAKALTAPLGSIARLNNKLQLTYNGRPVYTYAFDRHSADDQGDGVGGVWHYIELQKSAK